MKEIIKELKEMAKQYKETSIQIEKAVFLLESLNQKKPVIHDEYRPGCRQCPGCSKWIPCRKATCLCGHILNPNTKRIDERIKQLYQDATFKKLDKTYQDTVATSSQHTTR